ncbi:MULTISPECIES: sensor histidine kinase [Thiorhodovibrio]|uniref:sensor histidine kinase n=1 Tax=Thiorhodovibrio TaxID=61593 RepID=UPI0019139D3D|nr:MULTISPECIES: HAMP domain-containing sensor histidine kinase [Thiorhodovibrio]MBK5971222.1 ATP-binding protein [Thiorhodovibrio winogradskyi]WPL14630.1 Alginate biosynthesis sensor protein KinB [Thiorhodovibrio litoralis]
MNSDAGVDFSAVLAIGIHDMKNSLNRVLNAVDTLAESDRAKQPAEAEALAQLQYEARRMKDNLTKLLTIYRHDHGLYPQNFQQTNLYELLEDSWLNNKPLLDQRGLSCNIACDEELAWTLDAYLVGSLIENVLTNAVRYTTSTVRLSARRDGDWLVLAIDDDGPGYPESMLGRRTLHDSAAPDAKMGNTGLGLHFCALVAERHGAANGARGFIEVSNAGALGGGCFVLKLPVVANNYE